VPALAGDYRVFVAERRGHGRSADLEGPITYSIMPDDTIAFIEALELGPAHVITWDRCPEVGHPSAAWKRPAMRFFSIGSVR
jgi:hypothetical protein